MEYRRIPISGLDQLCGTRDLRNPNPDYGSSSLLLHDSRRDSFHRDSHLDVLCEVNSTSTPDTSFHSQSYSMFPCTHVLTQSVCTLNEINIRSLLFEKYIKLEITAIANALQLKAPTPEVASVPILFNYDAHAKFEVAQPIRYLLIAVSLLTRYAML